MVVMPHKLSPAKSASCLLSIMDNKNHHPHSHHQNSSPSSTKDYLLNNNHHGNHSNNTVMINNNSSIGECSLCWSDVCCLSDSGTMINNVNCSDNHHHHNGSATTTAVFGKCRNVRLRRTDPNQSLGFSIRGGWEHGIGFYVSDVQPDSLAAKQGLCPGDQIFRINGFPLDRVIHDEVVSLIRMSANDLTLRVRSVGVVPLKGRAGDKLTWKRLCLQRSTNETMICSGSSEVSSFVFQRPRSAASSLTTPSSNMSSSDDHLSSSDDQSDLIYPRSMTQSSSDIHNHHHHHHNDHHLTPFSTTSSISSSTSSSSRPIYCSNYNEQQLYIQCHQPGSSLGCSVVNGPATCPGIFVQHVKEGKLAQKCGLEIGDQIVRVNDVDVSVIGFEGAISMLKSMTNISLLVRKGVAKHIFECRDHHYVAASSSSSCQATNAVSSTTVGATTASPSSSPSSPPLATTTTTLPKCHYSQHYSISTNNTSTTPKSSAKLKSKVKSKSSTKMNGRSSSSSKLYSVPHPPTPPPLPPLPPIPITSTKTTFVVNGPAMPPPPPPITATINPYYTSSAAYSSVKISTTSNHNDNDNTSCDKNRCCCKRQRPCSIVHDQCSLSNGVGLHSSNVITSPPPTLFTNVHHVDQVTNAVANSIRILQEVREKEEKLVEASRKLSEEHEKLCREKEKLENEKKELMLNKDRNKENIYQSVPPLPSPHLLSSHHRSKTVTKTTNMMTKQQQQRSSPSQHHYSTIGSSSSSTISSISSSKLSINNNVNSAGNTQTTLLPPMPPSPPLAMVNQMQPQFSFLEEIKAMGENGHRRHLRPINSSDSSTNSGTTTNSSLNDDYNSSPSMIENNNNSNKFRRCAPSFVGGGSSNGCSGVGGIGKDASDNKKRQHELLMEEFRIAHQKMFGGQRSRRKSGDADSNGKHGEDIDDDKNDDGSTSANHHESSSNRNHLENVENIDTATDGGKLMESSTMPSKLSQPPSTISTLMNVFPRRNQKPTTTLKSSTAANTTVINDRPILTSFSTATNTTQVKNRPAAEIDHSVATKFMMKKSTSTFGLATKSTTKMMADGKNPPPPPPPPILPLSNKSVTNNNSNNNNNTANRITIKVLSPKITA